MTMQTLDTLSILQQIVTDFNIGYALVDEQLALAGHNAAVTQWMVGTAAHGQPITQLFPELAAMEARLAELFDNPSHEILISRIHQDATRAGGARTGTYFNLRTRALPEIGRYLLVTTENVTHQAVLEMQLRQRRNTLFLLLDALEKRKQEADQLMQERTSALEATNAEFKDFMSILTHDLQTPLVNIKGFVEEIAMLVSEATHEVSRKEPDLAAVQLTLDTAVPEALEFIRASVGQIDRFVQGVRQLERMGKRELDFELLDVQEIVTSLLSVLAHQIEHRQICMVVDRLPTVTADSLALEQIMGNLLTNAINYSSAERQSQITLTADTRATETIFHITDNGIGIAPEDLERVFKIFQRGKNATHVPGEGIGLPYVQALVRRHGGRIWCESTEGVGTTFSFTLPHRQTKA